MGPNPASVQAGITVKGQALEDYSGQWRPYVGDVALYFQPTGSQAWKRLTTIQANYNGRFSTSEPSLIDGYHLSKASGRWQARIEQSQFVAPSSSPPQYIRVGVATRIQYFGTGSHWSPLGPVRTIGGSLTECLGGSSPCMNWISMNRLTIELSFRYRGSKTWHYAKSVRTDAHDFFVRGDFGTDLPHTTRGTWWRAEFTGTDYIYGSASPIVYVPAGH